MNFWAQLTVGAVGFFTQPLIVSIQFRADSSTTSMFFLCVKAASQHSTHAEIMFEMKEKSKLGELPLSHVSSTFETKNFLESVINENPLVIKLSICSQHLANTV